MAAKVSGEKPKKSDRFLGVIYPDAENYDCQSVLEALDVAFEEWAYIVHDCDTDENGELKKKHIHWIGRQRSAGLASTVAKKLGIPENDVNYCKSWKSSVRYLIHMDSLSKFQYPLDAVERNFDIENFMDNVGSSNKALKIMRYIEERKPSVTELCAWSVKSGCYDEFRRGFAVWCCIMREADYVADGSSKRASS